LEVVDLPASPVLGVVPVVFELFTVLPWKACAATSEKTPVRATEPATNQRLTRLSLRKAASRRLSAAMR
jgi:hypothetical protein